MEFMQLFGDLDILPFVTISRLYWIGHVNRMHSKRRIIQVFNSNPRVSRRRGRRKKKTGGGSVYKEILINVKLQTGQRGDKTELTGGSSLRRRRCTLDCGVI